MGDSIPERRDSSTGGSQGKTVTSGSARDEERRRGNVVYVKSK
jgi:hypothetical protein